jgi:hypothetical protein
MYLNDMITNIRMDLGVNDVQVADDEVIRAIQKAVHEFSLFYPQRLCKDYTISSVVTNESFTTAATSAEWTQLGSKQIEAKSEVVKTADLATTYVRDTDYRMDYANGKIAFITGGGMSGATAYKVSYVKDRTVIDISDIADNLMRIVKVEYPAGSVPSDAVGFELFGSKLVTGATETGSQAKLTNGEHAIVWYHALHNIPTAISRGSYPTALDGIICLGAEAQLLYMMADKQLFESSDSLGDSKTALGLLTNLATVLASIRTRINTLADKIYNTDDATASTVLSAKAELIAAHSILAGSTVTDLLTTLTNVLTGTYSGAGNPRDKARDELGKLATLTANIETAISSSGQKIVNTVGTAFSEVVLADVITDLDTLDTTLAKIVDNGGVNYPANMATAIGRVVPIIANGQTLNGQAVRSVLNALEDCIGALNNAAGKFSEAATSATEISTVINDTEWANAKKYIEGTGGAAFSVSEYLVAMEGVINRINNGEKVPDTYVAAANVATSAASIFAEFAKATILKAQRMSEKSGAFGTSGNGYLGQADGIVKSASAKLESAKVYLQEVEAWNTAAQIFATQSSTKLQQIDRYLEVAKYRLQESEAFKAQADTWISEANQYLQNASGWLTEIQTECRIVEQQLSAVRVHIDRVNAYLSVGKHYIDLAATQGKTLEQYSYEMQHVVEEMNIRVAESGENIKASVQYKDLSEQYIKLADGYQARFMAWMQKSTTIQPDGPLANVRSYR